MPKKTRLTNTSIAALPAPAKGQRLYYDSERPGLAVRVTPNGKRAFVVDIWANGRSFRRAIEGGDCKQISVDVAWIRARKLIGELAGGEDPVEKRRERQAVGVTLEQVFADYLTARRNLSARTRYDYRRLIDTYFAKWKARPIATITKDQVEHLHATLGIASHAQANYAMRLLRALCNFARDKYERRDGSSLLPENPVDRLSRTRSWYRLERRRSKLEVHELRRWFAAIDGLSSDSNNSDVATMRDFLEFVLLTGLRRGEASCLRWDEVDLEGCTFTLRKTKNREAHSLPLPDHLSEMLQRRKATAQAREVSRDEKPSEYVFPGQGGRGYLVEPKKLIAKVKASSEIEFTLHDLRRTFITIAESLDIPAYALKRLLNHKGGSDVTAGYIVIDVERLRVPMQKITDYVLTAAGKRPSAEIRQLETATTAAH